MKIVSYNVNGLRSAINKNWMDWMSRESADVYCLQETKVLPEQMDQYLFEVAGYKTYWFPAEKKGYSGVAILSKTAPLHVDYGCSNQIYDCEGRILRADFPGLSVMSVYMPSGTTGEVRQAFKIQWLEFFMDYIETIKKDHPNLVICGDFNICHREIDIHDPKSNAKSSGFLPEEREWLSKFLESGFVDSFRHLNQNPHHYSWWSQRTNARSRNKGWRIDYAMISNPLLPALKEAKILSDIVHSDHCPVSVELTMNN